MKLLTDLISAAEKALAIAPAYAGGRPDVARDLRLALDGIKTTELESLLADLLEWESRMGGFDAPVWQRLRTLAQG